MPTKDVVVELAVALVARAVTSERLAGKLPVPLAVQPLVASTVIPWALACRKRPM